MTPVFVTGIEYVFSCYDGNDEILVPIPLPPQGAFLLRLVFCCLPDALSKLSN